MGGGALVHTPMLVHSYPLALICPPMLICTSCSPHYCSSNPRPVLVCTSPPLLMGWVLVHTPSHLSVPPCSPPTCSHNPHLVLVHTPSCLLLFGHVSLPALGLGLCLYSPAPFVSVSNILLVSLQMRISFLTFKTKYH